MRVRVGVVGYGYWGSKHVRVLQTMPDVEVVVIDHDAEKLAAARNAFPHLEQHRDLEHVLGKIDAAVLATAPSTHAQLATEVIAAGVHVLIEKPLATSTFEAERLVDLAERTGVVLMSGHTFEFNPAVQMLRDIVSRGDLGELHYIDSARLNLGLYQPDVNVIWDLAPHDISISNYLLGSAPARVSAWATRHAPTEYEDLAYLQLEYLEPHVHSYVHVSWLDPKKVRRVTIVGSDKMAVYNDVDPTEPIRIYDVGVDRPDSQATHDRPVSYRYGNIVSPRVAGDEPLAVEDRHFIECVRSGTRPLSDGASGLAVVRTVEAAVISARSNGRVIETAITRPVTTGAA